MPFGIAHSRKPQLLQRSLFERLFPPVAGTLAAAVLWALDFALVSDRSSAALLALPVWLAVGAAVGWLVRSRRSRTRERRLAEARLAAVENAAGDAVLHVGADGLISASSPAAEAIYGSDLGGRPLDELFPGADAETGHLTGEVLEQRRSDGSAFT